MNTPIANIIVTTEFFSVVVGIVLLYGTIFENRKKSHRRTTFAWMLVVGLLGNAVDAFSWIAEDYPDIIGIAYVTSILSCLVPFALYVLFVQYLYVYASEKAVVPKTPFRIIIWFCVASFILTLVIGLLGQLYVASSGYLYEGSWYQVYMIASLTCLVLALLVITLCSKTLGRHDAVASYLYVLIPGLSGLLNLLIADCSFFFPAATISMLIIYVMVQSERAAHLEQENQLVQHRATHDELTGVQNRRAYVTRLDQLQGVKDPLGVIFSDVNGLKFTNDMQGHAAGDRLLQSYTRILCMLFQAEDVYRVSGDEFVILQEGLTFDEFQSKVVDLQQLLGAEERQKACLGVAYGTGADVNEHIQWAEFRMYEQKKAFHALYPDMKR